MKKIKKKTPKKITLRNKCDKLVGADCRSIGRCEICGNSEENQWCHFITRGIIKLRYNHKNYACLCASCHFKAHDNPKWITKKWDEIRGAGTTRWLDRESNRLIPIGIDFYQKIIKRYEKED